MLILIQVIKVLLRTFIQYLFSSLKTLILIIQLIIVFRFLIQRYLMLIFIFNFLNSFYILKQLKKNF